MAYTSLADQIENLEKDPKFIKILDNLKKEQQESPARHALRFNMELWGYATEVQCHSMNVKMIARDMHENGPMWSSSDLLLAEKHLKEQAKLHDIAKNKYDKLLAKLEQAVVDEDNSKIAA